MKYSTTHSLQLLLLIVLIAIVQSCSAKSKGLTRVFRVVQNNNQQAITLPPILQVDPLASVDPLFGHSPTGNSFSMPDTENPTATQQGSTGLQPNYEVNRPTRILPDNVNNCTITLATRSFAHSYGTPLVMTYSPDLLPSSCNDPTKWVFIELTLSGNVSGRQFDRLGSVQLDAVEVLRTDNPEPTRMGVQWKFSKEMNKYYDLWKSERQLVFDFPNIVDDTYTGILNTTLSFTVYVPASSACKLAPLSASYPQIIALSKNNFAENSFFNVGDNGGDNGSTLVTFPINARAALVEIYASGTADDEFWYSDVPNEFYEQISAEASQLGLFPRGPLRELQVLVDDKLAGIAQPYPVVFTGGISPYFWRPQVSYGAYNQPTYYVDISPFLGSLTDGAKHNIQLKVASAEKNQTVLSWFISGNIQIQLDSSSKRTTGSIIHYSAPPSGDYTTTGQVGPNFNVTNNLQFEVEGPRSISIEASIQPGSSSTPYTVTWNQNTYYSNTNQLSNASSKTVQHASGQFTSIHGTTTFYSNIFSFPFETGSVGYNYTIDHSYDQTLQFGLPQLFKEPASQEISMTQKSAASMIIQNGLLVSGSGKSQEQYSYSDSNGFTFTQTNAASNGTVTQNIVGGNLKGKAAAVQ